MEKFSTHTGIGVPLRQSNVDTDQIIPAAYLKSIRRTGFEEALFARWRKKREDFVLNQEPYRKGSILVAGPNFGSGSSREHAVWALRDYGFKVVLSCRFADIFRENSGKQGLVAAVAGEKDIAKIWRAIEDNPGLNLTVDLKERCVTYRDAGTQRRLPFQIDDYTRWRLMNGFDDIDLTLQRKEEIEAFELARPSHKPEILPPQQR